MLRSTADGTRMRSTKLERLHGDKVHLPTEKKALRSWSYLRQSRRVRFCLFRHFSSFLLFKASVLQSGLKTGPLAQLHI